VAVDSGPGSEGQSGSAPSARLAHPLRPNGEATRKYGLEFWVVVIVETIAARGRKPRSLLRITQTGPASGAVG